MAVIQRELADHYIIAGYGNSGGEAARELMRRGAPAESIVVIDQDEAALATAKSAGMTVVNGDATRNATLDAVKIARAKAILVAAGRDDTPILIAAPDADTAARPLLINLRDAAPTGTFERVLEVVPADPEAREPQRRRWLQYKARGFDVNKHDR